MSGSQLECPPNSVNEPGQLDLARWAKVFGLVCLFFALFGVYGAFVEHRREAIQHVLIGITAGVGSWVIGWLIGRNRGAEAVHRWLQNVWPRLWFAATGAWIFYVAWFGYPILRDLRWTMSGGQTIELLSVAAILPPILLYVAGVVVAHLVHAITTKERGRAR